MKLYLVLGVFLLGIASIQAKDSGEGEGQGKAKGKPWGIGHCITRFACRLGGALEEKLGDAAGLHCYPGGEDLTKNTAKCTELCSNDDAKLLEKGAQRGAQRRNDEDDSKDSEEEAEATKAYCPVKCDTAVQKDHPMCKVNCRAADAASKIPACEAAHLGAEKCAACDQGDDAAKEKCFAEGHKANDNKGAEEIVKDSGKEVTDFRCTKKAGSRRMIVRRNKMYRRLGKFALARNYKGMQRVLRRMGEKGVSCKANAFLKILMYPIAIVKCVLHRLVCLVKADYCAKGNEVTIADAAGDGNNGGGNDGNSQENNGQGNDANNAGGNGGGSGGRRRMAAHRRMLS